jgi:ATP-dependent DNA ligase
MLAVNPPFEPMLAKLTREVPDGDGFIFEPKWDGFRCVMFRDGDELNLQSRNQKPLLRYFPELREPLLAQLPERCVLDGELVVVGAHGGLDFDALQLRQHPAESRVRKLSVEIPANYVAFDLLVVGDESLLDTPMEERRARLEALLAGAQPPLLLTPATRDPATARAWFDSFEGAGFDGVIAKPVRDAYAPGQRTLIKIKHERTCDCAVAGFRVHKDGNGVGSLLLGLYDGEGVLQHVGVASGMSAKVRAQLLADVEPLREHALDDHPWRKWVELAAAEHVTPGRTPGNVSRWNADKDLSWEPLRLERVAEVDYQGLTNGRFRHNAHFKRWRDDRDPSTCRYDQLEAVPPAELKALFHR